MSKALEETELIDLLLSLNFKVAGHTNTTNIVEHMNFSNGNIKVVLTDDNTHIFSINSDVTKLIDYEIGTKEIPVYVDPLLITMLEPYLIPEESIVVNIINWKYQPYEERLQEAIKFHNIICGNNEELDPLKERCYYGFRLTKQDKDYGLGYKYQDDYLPPMELKLGQYEDTEEELSINLRLLPILLKIKKGDKIYVIDETLVEAEVTGNSLVNGELMVFAHYPHKGIMYTPVCYYSKYGKTWALTKEELL